MNKERRAALAAISETLAQAVASLEGLAAEEQDYFDNMPESLQQSERGSAAEEAAQQLEEAKDHLQQAIDEIESAIGG